MVVENPETLVNTRICYPIVTIPLYKCGFLGLNMIVPCKLLCDSRLSAFFFAGSNKTATKVQEKAPFRVRVKIKFHIRHLGVGAKIGIFPELTKTATIIADGGGS